jgi:hypothetical protein
LPRGTTATKKTIFFLGFMLWRPSPHKNIDS